MKLYDKEKNIAANRPLFILEMANNHMGDVNHGVALIEAMGAVAADFPEFDFAMKLQYRHLDTFIHSSFKGRGDVPYVKRFEETRLSRSDFDTFLKASRDSGFKTMCTPFDENSVDMIEGQGIEIIKIASCSAGDWPLLERIAKSDKPIIFSTGAAELHCIDAMVSFFQHRRKDFSIMHCIAKYPTSNDALQMNQIDFLKQRYQGIRIGFSTHESPEATVPVMMGVAKGVNLFEKHVGLKTDQYALNAYSADPRQVRAWLDAARSAYQICGEHARYQADEKELSSVRSLRRGVFVKRDIQPGETLRTEDVEFAFPCSEGQLTANDWSSFTTFTAQKTISSAAPVRVEDLDIVDNKKTLLRIASRVNDLLDEHNVVVPKRIDLEISHHYGLENFDQFGLAMLTVVNRDYCKKIIVVLPGQNHPEQYHNRKEETFHVLGGDMYLKLDGEPRLCRPGDLVTITPGVRHEFTTQNGLVFEEISSTHFLDDSFYTDEAITNNKSRKTILTYWREQDTASQADNAGFSFRRAA